LIDFDQVDQEMQVIIKDAVGSLPQKAESAEDLLAEGHIVETTSSSADPDKLTEPGQLKDRVTTLRSQAEDYLRGIVLLERAVTGRVNPADDQISTTTPTVPPSAAATPEQFDGALADMRQELAESQAIHQALRAELAGAQHRIDALQKHQADLVSELIRTQQSSTTFAPASGTAAPDLPAPAASEGAGTHEQPNLAYQHCRYRITQPSRSAGPAVFQAAGGRAASSDATRNQLQAQLSEATEVAGSCLTRLADTDARLADLMEQVEQLEIAVTSPH
jgi:chromosome segregation ATPase